MTAFLTLGRLTSHPGPEAGLRTRFRDSQPTINWAAEPPNRTIFRCAINGFIAQRTGPLAPGSGVVQVRTFCWWRHHRRTRRVAPTQYHGDRRQLVLPVTSTIFAGRYGVIIRYGGTVDCRPTSQANEAETYGRQDTGNSSGQGWDERAFSAQVAERPIAVAGETGASVDRFSHRDDGTDHTGRARIFTLTRRLGPRHGHRPFV